MVTKCFIELHIPGDLKYEAVMIRGTEMFAPAFGDIIDKPDVDEVL